MGHISGVPAGIGNWAVTGGATSLPVESFGLLNPWLPEPLVPPLPPELFGKGGTPPCFKTVRVAPDEGTAIPPLPAAVANDVPVFFGCGRRAAEAPTSINTAAIPPAMIFFSAVQKEGLGGEATPAAKAPTAAAEVATGTTAAATTAAPTTTGATAFTPKLSGCSSAAP